MKIREKLEKDQRKIIERLEKEGVYITLSSLVEQEIEGAINIEIVLGEQTLLERIFLKAGKGV